MQSAGPFPSAVAHLAAARQLFRQAAAVAHLELREGAAPGEVLGPLGGPAQAALRAHVGPEALRPGAAPDEERVRRARIARWEARLAFEARVAATRDAGRVLPAEVVAQGLGLCRVGRYLLLLGAVLERFPGEGAVLGELLLLDGDGWCIRDAVFLLHALALPEVDFAFAAGRPIVDELLEQVAPAPEASETPGDIDRAGPLRFRAAAVAAAAGRRGALPPERRSPAPDAAFEALLLPDSTRRRLRALTGAARAWDAMDAAWGLGSAPAQRRGLIVVLAGPPGSGKSAVACAIARAVGLPLVLSHREPPAAERAGVLPVGLPDAHALEVATESRVAVCFENVDLPFVEQQLRDPGAPAHRAAAAGSCIVFVVRQVANEPLRAIPGVDGLFWLGGLSGALQEQLWRRLVPPRLPLAPDVDFAQLSAGTARTAAEIARALRVAAGAAWARAGAAAVVTAADLRGALRPGDSAAPLAAGAGSVRRPAFGLEGLAVPAEARATLEALVAAARDPLLITESWGVNAQSGVPLVVLLHGAPGVGKSTAAEAIAGALGRPLVDLACGAVRGRFVGEAEERLREAFGVARASGAVLLLDEVDAVLPRRGGERTQHHDDVLATAVLSLLDRHPGVVVLTTNRPSQLDPAVQRRAAWRVGLPLPDAAARAQIWRSCLPPSAPLHPRFDHALVADRYPVSGGAIRATVARLAAGAAATGRLITPEDVHAIFAEGYPGPAWGSGEPAPPEA